MTILPVPFMSVSVLYTKPVRFGTVADDAVPPGAAVHVIPQQVVSSDTKPDTQYWQDTIALPAEVHRDDFRRISGAPFLIHPLQVMILVATLAAPASKEELMAAALHDGIEDQPENYKRVKPRLLPHVDEIVEAATQNMTLSKKERRAAFIKKVNGFSSEDPLLASKLTVISADKIAGMRADMEEVRDGMLNPEVKPALFEDFYRDRFRTLEYYRRLSVALWDKWMSLPDDENPVTGKRDKDRLRPLMYELANTYFDFNQTIRELMPARNTQNPKGTPQYEPADTLYSWLKRREKEPLRTLRPGLYA